MKTIEATRQEEINAASAPHATKEMAALLYELSDAMIVMQDYGRRDIATLNQEERLAVRAAKAELRKERRKVRYRLFRIRDAISQGREPDAEYDKGLRAWIEAQFQPGMSWFRKNQDGDIIGGFTFEWDVSALEPVKVIRPFQWDGQIEKVPGPVQGQTMDRCDPAAFTGQA